MIAVRIITAPLLFVVVLIRSLYFSFRLMYDYIKNGGELNVYPEKDTRATLWDIYQELKEMS